MGECDTCSPGMPLALAAGEAHIWFDPGVEKGLDIEEPGRIISAAERLEAQQFLFERDAERYRSSHALLRKVLSYYLGETPEELIFVAGPNGKPALGTSFGRVGVCFNMSHSGDAVLIAVTRGSEVGVDLEKIRDMRGMQDVIRFFYTAAEKNYLTCCATKAQKSKAFFQIWTRKEAVVKAQAGKLAADIGAVDVPGDGCRKTIKSSSRFWCLHDLEIEHGRAAAVCIAGRRCRVSHRSLQELKPAN